MKKQISLILALALITFTFGQKMKVSEGNIKNLKGISHFDVIFDYTDLQIPKYDNETEFLKDKVALREKKEKGLGEKFKKSWFSDREKRYHPKFIESFNKRFKNDKVSVTENSGAKYIMHVHTTKLYAGYNVGVWRENAEINAEITIYSKTNPDKILLKGIYKNVPGAGGMGYDYDSGYRISECYAKLSKNIAHYIRKKAKK